MSARGALQRLCSYDPVCCRCAPDRDQGRSYRFCAGRISVLLRSGLLPLRARSRPRSLLQVCAGRTSVLLRFGLLPLRARSRPRSLLQVCAGRTSGLLRSGLLPLRARSRPRSLLQVLRGTHFGALTIRFAAATRQVAIKVAPTVLRTSVLLRSGFAAATRQIATKVAPTVLRRTHFGALTIRFAAATRQIATKAPTGFARDALL